MNGTAAHGPALRVLFVAYQFPPAGGVGVQRVVKFVKYLPEHGWISSVLTVANPSVPTFDQAMVDEIPASTIVRRARTYEPSYALKSSVAASHSSGPSSPFGAAARMLKDAARRAGNLALQPDAQILWRPDALREGLRLLKETPHAAIIATGPPFSSFLLGATLSRRTGVPLVLDYRDEWTISNAYWENKRQGRLANWVQSRMQRAALAQASVVLATTPSTAAELGRLAAAAGSKARVDYIYNGFDPSDYPVRDGTATRVDYGNGTDLFRMSFVGTLWNLNPIGPVVAGLLELARRAPDIAARLELVVAGRRMAEQEAQLDQLASTPVKLVRLPFVSHKDAVRLMCESDALLLLNADLPDTHRIVNAKTFEYMAARRPIFVVAPEGDLWDLVRDLPGTTLCRPGDAAATAEGLSTAIGDWQDGTVYDPRLWRLGPYERRQLAGKLAVILDQIAGGGGPQS